MSVLSDALKCLPDHRQRRGRGYRLDSILLLVLAGFLCGCTSLKSVWRFGCRLSREQREALGFLWFRLPSHPTLCVTLQGLDVEALEAALSQVVLASADGEPGHLCLDGKCLRGSVSDTAPRGVQVLACFSERLRGVVAQKAASGGYGEVTAAIALLSGMPLKDTVITGDALFADRTLCRTIVQGGGAYVFPLKGNQPSLRRGVLEALQKKSPADA